MALCKECGLIVPEGSSFCNGCGAKIEKLNYSAEETIITEEKLVENESYDENDEDEYYEDDEVEVEQEDIIPFEDTEDIIYEDTEEDENIDAVNNVQVSQVSQKPTFSSQPKASSLDEKTSAEKETPLNDPYWDDVKPEIENEIYQIPKDIIIKGVIAVFALLASIAWLIIML